MIYKLKKKLFKKHTIGMAYEKLSYNTTFPPVIVQTYIVTKKDNSIKFIKYRKIVTNQTYYQLLDVLHAKGYKDISDYV